MTVNFLRGKDGVAVILTVGAFLIFATMGIRQSFGLFLVPYTESLGIGRESFSLAIAAQNLVWGLFSPFFGALADRKGPVLAIFLGGLFYTLGLFIMAAASDAQTLFIAQVLVGAGMAGAGFSVVLGAVGKVVKAEKRSISLAVVTAAGSIGQFALVPMAQGLLTSFGADGSLWALAAVAVLIMFSAPLMKLPPHAPKAKQSVSGKAVLQSAFASKSYVMLGLGFFVCGFQVVFVATHLPAYVADAGLPPTAAATALALIGLFNIIGTIVCGWLGDKISKKNTLTIFYLLRSAVIALFLFVPLTSVSVAVFGAAIGFLWLGTVPLTSGLISVFFGVRYLSMLYGFVFLSHQIGSFMGAWLGGFFYDATGGYDPVWYFCIALGVVAALLHYPIKERPDLNFSKNLA